MGLQPSPMSAWEDVVVPFPSDRKSRLKGWRRRQPLRAVEDSMNNGRDSTMTVHSDDQGPRRSCDFDLAASPSYSAAAPDRSGCREPAEEPAAKGPSIFYQVITAPCVSRCVPPGAASVGLVGVAVCEVGFWSSRVRCIFYK